MSSMKAQPVTAGHRDVSPVVSSRKPLPNMATLGVESSQESSDYLVNCHQHLQRIVVVLFCAAS